MDRERYQTRIGLHMVTQYANRVTSSLDSPDVPQAAAASGAPAKGKEA